MSDVAYSAEDRDIIEARVHEQLPLVKRIAFHLLGRLPARTDVDDLLQAGMMGLLAAARDFSPSHGASFSTYAGIRIRGAILDEIRQSNWAPRSVQKKSQVLAKAVRDVEARTGQSASDRELADELGVSLDEYHGMAQDVASGQLMYMDEETTDSFESEDDDPFGQIQDKELKEAVIEAIERLPEKEKLVMAMYYQEELNLKEIGQVLGVSESRVCQIHGQALTRIRARMQSWTEA